MVRDVPWYETRPGIRLVVAQMGPDPDVVLEVEARLTVTFPIVRREDGLVGMTESVSTVAKTCGLCAWSTAFNADNMDDRVRPLPSHVAGATVALNPRHQSSARLAHG